MFVFISGLESDVLGGFQDAAGVEPVTNGATEAAFVDQPGVANGK